MRTVLILLPIVVLLFVLMQRNRPPRRPALPTGERPPATGAVCSFCGKNQDVVRTIIAGPSVFICDECIDLCNDIIAEKSDQERVTRCVLCRYPKEPADVVEVPGHGTLCRMCVDDIRTASAQSIRSDG